MAHELRTPTAAVIALLGALKDTSLSGEQRGIVEAAQSGARHLMELVSLMLPSEEQAPPEPFAVSDLFGAAVTLVEAHAPHVRVLLVIEPDVPVLVLGRAMWVRQIVLNLLSNAVKFARGHVWCTVRASPSSELHVEIRDDGPGVRSEDVPRLFDGFFQGAGAAGKGGVGIGLALSRALCRRQGGDLEYVSLQEEARFLARIPVAVLDELPVTSECPTCLRVVLVDDDWATRTLAMGVIRRLGHSVHEFVDGPSAMEHILREPPDLAIVDLELPGMGGLELTRLARRAGIATAIVGATAHVLAAVRPACVEAGMDDLLEKPLDAARIERILAMACRAP